MVSLFDRLTLKCGLSLDNRAALAPLTNTQSHEDGTLGDDEFSWLLRRAEGGFGLVSTCACYVSEEGKAWQGQLGIDKDAQLPGLRKLAAALRSAGAKPIVQLFHGGYKASFAPGEKLSAVDDRERGIRAATSTDIERVMADFVSAARRAQQAGFAGVEIHGANGYLFTQFLAPKDNTRTDAYGRDLAGRAKLLRDTLLAVRDAVEPGFAVGVRISPVDVWERRGLILSEGVQLSRWLADDGADFIHLSLADAAGPAPHEVDGVLPTRAVRDALPADVALSRGWWHRDYGRCRARFRDSVRMW